jgi:hypothetical protein
MDDQIIEELARRLEPEFPDAMQQIKRHQHDESFQDMCAEYEDGVKCLRGFGQNQRERIDEYTELIDDLQQEILCYLRDH